jgi:tetratricopeptide (TPR) repeat protein
MIIGMSRKFNLYFVVIIALVFGLTIAVHKSFEPPEINVSKQDSARNINRDFLRLFSSGHKRILSSSIWIITLLEADDEKYRKKDGNSWMYHRFMSIADLEPDFYQNYLYGGMFLSIIKDDLFGAAELYERGLKKYPKDYSLNYNAGFNYYFEIGDYKKGLPLLENILDHPRVPWRIKFLVNKLKFEVTHQYDVALDFLRFNLTQTKDEALKQKIQSDIYALKAERDLKCLNEKKPDCEKFDEDGKAYILKNGTWITQKNFTPYKIYRNK